jgi:hypothetical protein
LTIVLLIEVCRRVVDHGGHPDEARHIRHAGEVPGEGGWAPFSRVGRRLFGVCREDALAAPCVPRPGLRIRRSIGQRATTIPSRFGCSQTRPPHLVGLIRPVEVRLSADAEDQRSEGEVPKA